MSDLVFLEVADRIANRLCRDAVWAGRACNWLGWSMEPVGGRWLPAFRTQPGSLYNGTAGIALFLAQAAAFTNDRFQRAAAEGALNTAVARLATGTSPGQAGLFSGTSGIADACRRVGTILGDGKMFTVGCRLLESVAIAKARPPQFDVLDGSAGIILASIAAWRDTRNPTFVEAAVRHGVALLETASRTDAGYAWTAEHAPQAPPLLGYAHGTAGVACALFELWSATGEHRFREGATEAIRYEQSHFSAADRNWPDFRPDARRADGTATFMAAWCHGAGGIGLSRLRVLQIIGRDESVLADVAAALDSTRRALTGPPMPGTGYSLCHGHAGNAELLLAASQVLSRPDLRAEAEQVGRVAAGQHHQWEIPWPCGVPNAGETPNLMLGLAGIGYFYLRMFDPARVPSILMPTMDGNRPLIGELSPPEPAPAPRATAESCSPAPPG